MTNIPGCFNVGESEFQYHGANRLGANSLLSCIFGWTCRRRAKSPVISNRFKIQLWQSPFPNFHRCIDEEEALKHDLMRREGNENVHKLHDELADVMVKNVTVKRNNADLEKNDR